MTLREVLAAYRLERDVSEQWISKLGDTLKHFAAYLRHPPNIVDLNDATVNEFILSKRGVVSPRTVKNYRNNLITLWRFAVESGRYDELPRRVRVVKVPEHRPVAWCDETFAALLAAAKSLPGNLIDGTPRGLYFGTLYEVDYHCGLRKSDVLAMDLRYRVADTMLVIQRKTGKRHVFSLPLDTWAAVENLAKIPGRKEKPLRWPIHDSRIYYWTKRICELAGVERGALQRIRRTGASLIARTDREAASRYLGHKTPTLAAQYYIDPVVAGEVAPRPPEVRTG